MYTWTLSPQHIQLLWHVVVAVAVRLLLVLLGAGEVLIWQPEVSTPANTVLKVREGLALLRLGVSPYAGDSCHVPPLWLAVSAPFASHHILYVIPNIICDVTAAVALYAAASCVYDQPPGPGDPPRGAPWLAATQVARLYLLSPFALLSCVAGTSTSVENAAVLVAVAGGCWRNGPVVACGLAVGAYLGLHPCLLLVPLLVMLWQGAEDPLHCVPQRSLTDDSVSSAADAVQKVPLLETLEDLVPEASQPGDCPARQQQQQQAVPIEAVKQQRSPTEEAPQGQEMHQSCRVRDLRPCICCAAWFIACSAALLVLSDLVLEAHPGSQCILSTHQALPDDSLRDAVSKAASPSVKGSSRGRCWAGRVYGLTVLLHDLTPNMGLWWYFFTEVFREFQPFFLFVFHSFAVVLIVPLTVRFSKRPLFVTWATLFISSIFRPYPCIGALMPWVSLLPLLQQQLQSMKLRMFLVNSFALLAVLGPAMWHQWIVLDSANANFFYSITLLLGVWYTVFLMQMLRLTVLWDRCLAGKGPPPVLVDQCGEQEAGGAVQFAGLLQAQVAHAEAAGI